MTTARQARETATRTRKERELARRTADRELLRRLRDTLRASQRLKRERFREVVSVCRQARAVARERARAFRLQARATALAQIDSERQASRSRCERDKAGVRAREGSSVARALEALELEQKHQASLRRWAKRTPLRRPSVRTISAVAESDSEVEANIPEELVSTWRAVRSRIRGTPRRTRTEAFTEWAAEHAAEVAKFQDKQLDAEIRELVRRESELRERSGTARTYRRMSDAELEVPF